jgi:NlpC/P60 family putative phage cell wall peptidase
MNDELRAQVVAEAKSWLGTPYHHHARIKGVGVDCAQLLCAVYEACGCVPHIDLGNYAHDWHLHRGEEAFFRWLAAVGAKSLPSDEQPEPGDVAVFRYGRAFSHGAVVVERGSPGSVVHAYIGRGVICSRLDQEPLQGRMMRLWRLTLGKAASNSPRLHRGD